MFQGCWCYFDENHGKGKGQPVNAIDEKCRQLAHAYDCAIMDAEDAGEPPCVPWDVQYRALFIHVNCIYVYQFVDRKTT